MKYFRKYGKKPFNIAVLHGGPGASGEMAPVAKELSKIVGILEPLQTEKSIDGQIEELKKVIEKNGNLPITLIGWSWGAWLGYLFTVKYPSLVKKLILVSSGPFEQKYVKEMEETRKTRQSLFSKKEKAQLEVLEEIFKNPKLKNKDSVVNQFSELLHKVESYDSLKVKPEIKNFRSDIYNGVWPEAAELRRTGELLKLGKKIKCPVVAIHGDYDTHPYLGVKTPLSKVVKNFKFILLKHCGHSPWIEREAKDEFYKILKKESFDNF